MALYYCRKCGRIVENTWNEEIFKCDCCESITYPVPMEYWLDGKNFLINDEKRKKLIDDFVKTSPEFDPYLFEHRDEILSKHSAEFRAKMEHGKAVLEGRDKGNKFGVECPYCHATNVKKITASSKVVRTALFGIFSVNRNSKQWHCNRCDSDF